MFRFFWKILFTTGICLVWISTSNVAQAQQKRFEEGYYRQPLDGNLLLSANFAEARTDHFHSGIDIKTGGVEGKPLYAAADGYIARIGALPTGFGRVLYINHPNNTTTVYAHMQKFTPEVEAYVKSERYRLRRHRVDLNPAITKFPVKKGQLIGYSGNSGSSGGPHLHFEIRDTPSQRILNVPALQVYNIKDDIAPTIAKLYYIETENINGIPVDHKPKPIEVTHISGGEYKIAGTSAIEVGKNGYFVIEATDRKNDTHNTMGIYNVDMRIDNEAVFSFKLDSYLFTEQRYVNSQTHYSMQKGMRNEFIRLAVQPNNKLPIYSGVKNSGLLSLNDPDEHLVEISVMDDNRNKSYVSFKVKRRNGEAPKIPESATEGTPLNCKQQFTNNKDGLAVSIPANSLYESIFYTQAITGNPERSPQGRRLYTPIYSVHTEDVPLHMAMTISLDVPEAPAGIIPKLCIARVSADGNTYSYVGGKYSNGKITVSTRNFGRYCVMADNQGPTITPSFSDGANLSDKDAISFTLADDFSGVSYFTANIDGKWIPFEQQGRVITHYFDPEHIKYNGDKHNLTISATDNTGNTSTITRTFIR